IAGGMGAIPEMVLYMALASAFSKLDWADPGFFFFRLLAQSKGDTAGRTLAAVVYATLISTAVGQAIGFVLNRKMAFRANSNVALSIFLTLLLIVFTIAANTLVVGPGADALLSRLAFLPQWLIDMAAKIIAMCASVAWVYPANRFVIHRQVNNASRGGA
ncbi:MAG: hypothetical protein LBB75_01630, partial [Oscillospiraceae bacterium]|nr:hypothetical protein [Oscillospiraceae bacterium]